jgi:hypothetical protein
MFHFNETLRERGQFYLRLDEIERISQKLGLVEIFVITFSPYCMMDCIFQFHFCPSLHVTRNVKTIEKTHSYLAGVD